MAANSKTLSSYRCSASVVDTPNSDDFAWRQRVLVRRCPKPSRRKFCRKCTPHQSPTCQSRTCTTCQMLMATFLRSQVILLFELRHHHAACSAPDKCVFAITAARYGAFPAQFKAFLDATGQLWQKGALVGKPITFITSTASLGGGQEATIMSSKYDIKALLHSHCFRAEPANPSQKLVLFKHGLGIPVWCIQACNHRMKCAVRPPMYRQAMVL